MRLCPVASPSSGSLSFRVPLPKWRVFLFLRLKTLRTKTRFSWFPCFVNTGAICKVAGMKSNRCSEGFLVVKRKPLFEYRLLEDQDAFDILCLVASQ